MIDTNNNTKTKKMPAAARMNRSLAVRGRSKMADTSVLVKPKAQRRKSDPVDAVAAKKPRVSALPINETAGQVYMFGTGDCGQLGLGEDITKRNYPCIVPELKDTQVIQIAAGGMHTTVLDRNGKVFTFGVNDDKALGRKTEEEEENFKPGEVKMPFTKGQKVVQISAGDSHTAALTDVGEVYAWGTFKDINGNFGLLPNADRLCFDTPQLIYSPRDHIVVKIASGDHHLVMLTDDHKVLTCGIGEQGQLGRNFGQVDENARNTRARARAVNQIQQAQQAGGPNPKALQLTPTEIQAPGVAKAFSDIWAGGFSTFCRTERNEVWVFGLNNMFQLGVSNRDAVVIRVPTRSQGLRSKKWAQIAAGQHHAVGLDEEGNVWTWGRCADGRLGLSEDPEEEVENTPEAIGRPSLVPGLKNHKCSKVAAGLSTAYAITPTGQLFAWGFGENFQLGTGTSENLYGPKAVMHKVVDNSKKPLDVPVFLLSAGGQHVGAILQPHRPN